MSRTGELNDNCFSLATELAANLSSEFKSELGSKPTVSEFAELLKWGIGGCGIDLFSGMENDEIIEIKIKTKKRKQSRPKIGDVIAVPSDTRNKFHMIIYIGRFRIFGDAFGMIEGRYLHRKLPSSKDLNTKNWHRFVGIEAIREGRWKIVENRPDLVDAFSQTPEYFHSKANHPGNPDIGPYGSAEKPYVDGQPTIIRHLSEKESKEIGLDDPRFRMFYLEEDFEAFLNSENE